MISRDLEDQVLGAILDGNRDGFGAVCHLAFPEDEWEPQTFENFVKAIANFEDQGWVQILKHDESGWAAPTMDERGRAMTEYRKALCPSLDKVYAMLDVELPSPPHGLYVELTTAGKAEWRRRYPTAREDMWKAELDPKTGTLTVWAIDNDIADSNVNRPRATVDSFPPSEPPANRVSVPARFELKTGDIVDGVKVTYRWLNPEATTSTP